MILLIGKNRADLHVQHLHHMRRQLIGMEIFVILFHAHIIPDQILRPIEVAAFEVILRHIQRRNMVSVHHKHRRFFALSERVCQRLDELVHFIDLVDIVFIFPL